MGSFGKNLAFDPVGDDLVKPETVFASLQEPEVAAEFGCHEFQVWIGAERRMVEDLEGDKRVVLRLNQQRWDTDAIKELLRGLGFVVAVRGTEAK